MYILDTNVLINLHFNIQKTVDAIDQLKIEKAHITVFNLAEFLYGAINKIYYSDLKRSTEDKFNILSFTYQCVERFIKIKYQQKIKGMKIPVLDMLVASIAIQNNMVLVTYDQHFKDIKGLKSIILK